MKILDAISLAVAVAFAAPAALFGVETLLGGDQTGWVFLGFAAGILAFERYLTTPTDLPALAAQKTAEVVAEDPDDDNQ
ncbi:DUF7533 family protein [Halobacterium litoreum]|uniref:Uncharacterized protein n=1 Tax=Halobacterium litoreum TaxID=2039234 RepID=A0ABD5NG54_9EURY|nr:hypothetical protein [Halobacterium litoreum]UHH13016.1 hypothetical protein LT972_12740 [Halobacterium litoreum]